MTSRRTTDLDDASTILRRSSDEKATTAVAYEITVIDGPDTGAKLVLDGTQPPRVLVGSSAACALRLSDREISRRHIAFDTAGPRLRITDLESTNGTFVNDVALVDGYLRGGETVRIGATRLLVGEAKATNAVVSTEMRFGRVVGASPAMRRLYPLCRKLATSAVPLILEGETGTGKELLAEALHDEGPRSAQPFVVFDCTAVPPHRIEIELFGSDEGESRRGVFEQAHGGTLLIDEIGDLDIALQPKLLRALERSEIRRVGGSRSIQVNTRIVVATRRNLDKEVQAGRFRDDLFFRLAVARIELPRLRDRVGDIGLLARHFFRELEGAGAWALSPAHLAQLEDYPWPGNVRELRNAVARRIALGDLDGATASAGGGRPAAAPEASAAPTPNDAPTFVDEILAQNLPMPLAREKMSVAFERRYMAHILARYDGNVARAAAASGLARRYFQLLRARHQG